MSLPSSFGAKDCAKTAAIAEDSTKEHLSSSYAFKHASRESAFLYNLLLAHHRLETSKAAKTYLRKLQREKLTRMQANPKVCTGTSSNAICTVTVVLHDKRLLSKQ